MSRSPAAVLSCCLTVAALGSGAALAPVTVAAQGDDMVAAREAFARGQALFDAGDYRAALAAFGESLDAFPHFRTIFNIALCHERLGDVAAAVGMYERYVEWPSEVPNREEIRDKAAELRLLLPSEPEPEPEPGPPATVPVPPSGPSPVASPPEAEPGPDLRVPGWIAVGAGAAGLIAGGVLLGLAGRRASEIDDLDGVPYEPGEHDALQREGRAFEAAGWVTAGAGAAVAAAGVALLLLSDHEAPAGAGSGAAPAGFAGPVAGGAAIGVGGRF